MREKQMQDIRAIQKSICEKLLEVTSLTQELDEAVNRQDQVSVRLLLLARRKPLCELCAAWAKMDLQRCELSPQEVDELEEILSGAGPEGGDSGAMAALQQSNQRLLQRLKAMDQAVSRKICRERSYYKDTDKRA